ncbi:TRAP transporter large permease [Chloroflexota bacterium]
MLVISLALIGVPIAFVLAMVASGGIVYIAGWDSLLYSLGSYPFGRVTAFTMVVIPLFVLMGELTVASGTAEDAYNLAERWLGRLRGGLVIASLGAQGLIAACTGSGVTGTVAMGKIAVPEMRKRGYDEGLAVGAVAAGGTVGVLIPPSLGLVVYGVATNTSIGDLFIAGIIPGIISVFIYQMMVFIRCWFNPKLAPLADKYNWNERLIGLVKGWGIVAMFTTVMVGLYGGFITPMEVGAVASLIGIVLWIISKRRGRASWAGLKGAFWNTAKLCGMIFALLIGGGLFSLFVVMSGSIPPITEFFVNLPFPRFVTALILCLMYIPMGMFLDGMSMTLLTAPIVFPIIVYGLGYSPVWFGIVQIKLHELGAITPPVAINLFVAKGLFPDIKIETIIRGTLWFMAMDIITFVFLFAFPAITTWLPSTMH